MANTINDLYLKYVNNVSDTLEEDRYFQYLFEMVQAGTNEIQQNHRIMHKVVDERWLTTIEESLDAINNIIEKPRRFIATKEEVVPVALAKKITADSVRHLSMNTQFIASSEDGDIQPTRVLNVSTEESYDLYENRFIYHLIQRLVTFIDKRTDVIFWSTGDETKNVLNFQSKVDDAYEEIEYKIEMTVKNHQSFAENDNDNMQVFMRIDRVRRMVMSLRNSAFCNLMAGCAKVRSPIQRTNLLMKDPDYRTCYKLWQFLESYDEVGYSIVVQDQALQFDEEYMIQLYINLITNYTVFKSLLETDTRDPNQVLAKHHKTIKPKFIKKIKEEIVNDYDIEDVEIRQVIIEEVTQAQLDAEAKLAEEQQHCQELEQTLEELDAQLLGMEQQLMSTQQQMMAAMDLQEEAEARAEEEMLAKEAEMAAKEAAMKEKEAAAKAREQEARAREEAEKQAASELESRLAAEEKIHKLEEELAALRESQRKAELSAQKAKEESTRMQNRMQELKETTRRQVKEAEASARTRIKEVEKSVQRRIKVVEDSAEERFKAMEDSMREQIKAMEEAAQERIKSVEESAQERIKAAEDSAQIQIKEMNNKAESQVKQAQETVRAAQEKYKSELEHVIAQRDIALEEKRKAQAKADANSLSKYIISVLNERRQRNEAMVAEEKLPTEEEKENQDKS